MSTAPVPPDGENPALAATDQRLRELADSARPYVERAAPDEHLWDEDDFCNYERLRAALAAADRYARVHREHGYGPEGQEARAALKATLAFASPDERLREAAGLLSRAKTALRAHRLNWLALSDRLDAPYPDRPDSSPWSRFALPVCQRGKLVEDEIVAALAAADREAHLEPAPQNDATRAQIVAAKLIADREAPDEETR